jgi:hypothetical protein
MPFDQSRAFLAFGSVGTSLVNGGVMRTGTSRTVKDVTLNAHAAQGGPPEKPKS